MSNKKLAVCAMFENEARYLPEWLAYHRLAGIAEFVLYDNGSTDDPALAIRNSPLAEHVTLIHWRQRPGQPAAYKHFIDIFAPGFDWVAFLDVDQFLLPLGTGNVVDTLESLNQAAAVLVQRRVFGPGAWQEPPPGLVIENYDRRAADDDPANNHVTTIARCSELAGVTANPNEFRVIGPVFNTAGHLAPNNAIQVQPCYQNLVVNHYYTRSRQDWLAKLQRASATEGATARQDEPGLFDHLAAVCQVRDATIQSHSGAVRTLLGLDAAPSPPPEAIRSAEMLPATMGPGASVSPATVVAETAAPASAPDAAQRPRAAEAPRTAPGPRAEQPNAAAPARVQVPPGWVPRGPDAQERTGGLGLVFCDRSRAGEHWFAGLRGIAAAAIDPAFLRDEYDRIRDFPTAAEARAACDAALALQGRH